MGETSGMTLGSAREPEADALQSRARGRFTRTPFYASFGLADVFSDGIDERRPRGDRQMEEP
jgi:hypothetical protein